MSSSRLLPSLARNIASSSRLALPQLPKQAALRPVRAQLRSKSTLCASPSTRLPALLAPRHLQNRNLRTSSALANDRASSRIEAFIPETSSSDPTSSDDPTASIPVTGERTPIGQIEQRLAITFTCTVDECGHRSSHEFSKRSYTKGIVIVQCPGCKNRHLIADNLSWFTEREGEPRTIEQMIEAKGGTVRRGTVDGETGETIEILS
ncbi:related to ZIM17-Zinc finger Motif protein, mitochondrial [Sporisorium reilianum SRZ2]|uniref:Related to ZIM17-Zinc finger Motif protein, mitochondrial n=1 Tax=Sporisorium reilianum (strain SRZ2) TaxID=999809 RepID=E6ZLS2_SPORE|nr:related to ZIM17-Zinc finger Motif protein, mitochondrial [Sporisorium reilianum SRZ2]